jgi:hypothetical protein
VLPAIIVVAYNRPKSLDRLLHSLSCASYPKSNVNLIISIDYSGDDNCYKLARSFSWSHGTKRIIQHKQRMGLRAHVISCGDLSAIYGSVIILEDDLLVSPSFYYYAASALDKFASCNSVAGISLYSHSWNDYSKVPFVPEKSKYDAYFGQFSITWGECWTCNQWNGFKAFLSQNKFKDIKMNIPEQINNWPSSSSWGKFFVYYLVSKNKFYVIPYTAMSTTCSDCGEHSNSFDPTHQVPLLLGAKTDFSFPKFDGDSIKYDIFFERILPESFLKEINLESKQVSMKLNSKVCNNSRFVFTTKKCRYKVLLKYGLSLRPIEENVLKKYPGDSIFLYDTTIKAKKPKTSEFAHDLYYFYHYDRLKMICFALSSTMKKIIRKVSSIILKKH